MVEKNKKLRANRFKLYAFNAAINYAIDVAKSDAVLFLSMWREGDWEGIKSEFSDFDLKTVFKTLLSNVLTFGFSKRYAKRYGIDRSVSSA